MKDFDYGKFDTYGIANDLKTYYDEQNVRKILKIIYRYERCYNTSLIYVIRISKDVRDFKIRTNYKARGIGEKTFNVLKKIYESWF